MKTRISLFGILAAIMLMVSLILPGNLVQPATASADAGVCKWERLEMPGSVGLFQVDLSTVSGLKFNTENEKLVPISDGSSFLAIVDTNYNVGFGGIPSPLQLWYGTLKGIDWTQLDEYHLWEAMTAPGARTVPPATANVWDAAAAPDDPLFWAVVTSGFTVDAPCNVWVTTDGGASWQDTQLDVATGVAGGSTANTVGAIDISPSYSGRHDIAVGLRTGTGIDAFRIFVLQSGGFTGWLLQNIAGLKTTAGTGVVGGDVEALKFSPTYVGDSSLAIVFSCIPGAAVDAATFYNVAIRDISTSANQIVGWAWPTSIEVVDPNTAQGDSPSATTIVNAQLQLPSDFSGQSTSLRRAYISIDSGGLGAPDRSGIFRIDDTTVYVLMNTTGLTATGKRIHSIAYFGTYASGKLLAGEVNGQACSATVPTWFTDSPTTCPIPCWYPALKPTTGAAGQAQCDLSTQGIGAAYVIWSLDGTLAYVATSERMDVASGGVAGVWYANLIAASINNDESAIAISRNNGETWNQIGLINTTISWFNDTAITADCNTVYLASSNNTTIFQNDCRGFDSVWRASKNSKVVAPFTAALPLGSWWERVFTHVTAVSCNATAQSKLPLLRLPPAGAACDNGAVVGWAAQNTIAQAWSPDYGDYWAMITPRHAIQDFAFESPTMLYDLSAAGIVQAMPYTGTAWSSAEQDSDSLTLMAHTIIAKPDGVVAVGAAGTTALVGVPVSLSRDGAKTWQFIPMQIPTAQAGNVHLAFDPAFDDNGIIYAATSAAGGTVFRLKFPDNTTNISWTDVDMMAAANGNGGAGAGVPHHTNWGGPWAVPFMGYYGIQTAFTGGALYAAHAPVTTIPGNNSGVERTIDPLDGMPKPGITWDCLNVYQPAQTFVTFTREPWSLKICGCCTMDTNSKLWALDARNYVAYPGLLGLTPTGFLWGFEDCLAKKGPALITEDGTLIGCDPVSGRAQEVNLCWEQLCVANGYNIEIAKDKAFTIKVISWAQNGSIFVPVDVTNPCAYFPAGGAVVAGAGGVGGGVGSGIGQWGNLECGHQYFWHIQVRLCATGEILRSQWSGVRSFTVKAGLPVVSEYYGLELLSPDNGCQGCPVQPASFSWSPFMDTTKYKFVLAKDAAMTQVLAEAEVPTTAYEYDGKLDYSTNYFWRVMSEEPAPSDWSATFSFQTEPAPAAPAAPAQAPATPLWAWVVIAIAAILVIVTLVLIFRTSRT